MYCYDCTIGQLARARSRLCYDALLLLRSLNLLLSLIHARLRIHTRQDNGQAWHSIECHKLYWCFVLNVTLRIFRISEKCTQTHFIARPADKQLESI